MKRKQRVSGYRGEECYKEEKEGKEQKGEGEGR